MTEEEKAELNAITDAKLTLNYHRDRMFPLNFADVWNVGAWEYLYANLRQRLRQRFGMLPLWFKTSSHLTKEEYLWLLRGGDQ